MTVDDTRGGPEVSRPRTARGRRTRDAIVEAAAEMMAARGIAATGLGDVLAASGAGKSQLYHYFAGKRDLVRAVLDHQLARVLAAQPELDGDDVTAWVDGVVALQHGRHGPLGCPLGVFGGQVEDDPVLRDHLAAAFDTWRDRIASMVAAAQRAGRADPSADPAELAGALLAALQGGLLLASLHRDPHVLDVALRAAAARVRGCP